MRMGNKKLTLKDLARILSRTVPKIVLEEGPSISLMELVNSIERYPIFERMYQARQRATPMIQSGVRLSRA